MSWPDYGDAKEDLFETFLKSKGFYYTYERRLILYEIMEADKTSGHFSVEIIFKNLQAKRRRVSKSTLYKTLRLLEECRVIKKTDIASGYCVYEKIGQSSAGHLVCLKCGKIIEMNQMAINNLIGDTCKKEGFKVKSHTFEIKGLCFDCLKV